MRTCVKDTWGRAGPVDLQTCKAEKKSLLLNATEILFVTK